MGPRLGSRGKAPINTLMRKSKNSFNGAATWKSRKASVRTATTLGVKLQWGRDLEVAES